MDIIGKEIEYYKANRKDLIKQYAGKHLVIKGMQVVGVFNSRTEAYDTAMIEHGEGTFIIEHPLDIKVG